MEMLSDLEQSNNGPEMDLLGENIGSEISPDLLTNQKRAPGMEFVGKRSGGLWNDRLGFGKGIILKRAPGMEFVGKRNSWMKFMRKIHHRWNLQGKEVLVWNLLEKDLQMLTIWQKILNKMFMGFKNVWMRLNSFTKICI